MSDASAKQDIQRGIKLIIAVCVAGLGWSILNGWNMAFWHNNIIDGVSTVFFILFGLLFVASIGLIATAAAGSRLGFAGFSLFLAVILALPFIISHFGRHFAR